MNINIRNKQMLEWFGFEPVATGRSSVDQSVRLWLLSLWWSLRFPRRLVK